LRQDIIGFNKNRPVVSAFEEGIKNYLAINKNVKYP
jgi:hypothetical protein